MKQTVHATDLFPASLLSKRQLWRRRIEHVPVDAIVLIACQENSTQVSIIRRLSGLLREQGLRVFVLAI